jgi:acyl transferase domain-containing protein/thioesterase domain-containing protein/acyl carrier protein
MGDLDSYSDQDIAIVGMALRFPGATNPEQFWSNLCNGVESVQFYRDEELIEAGVTPVQLKNPHYVKAGAPLHEMEYFDAEFFGFSPKEGGILDPQHRHFYECAWEALEDAGHPPENFDGAIGVFGGCGMGAYFAFNLITNPDLVDSVGMFLLRHTGNDKDFLSSRVSYSFDLKGPSINVQTACSTSLVATHLACQSLLSGECDMALAGGSTIEIPHRVGYLYKEGEILSPDGHCRAFDHRSKGTIFGSGTGLVVLRRMEDAINDGDNIYAVVKGTAVNNDGSGKVGYLAPSVDGQAAAIVESLAVADVEADSIDYVECHGTGTPVGDPIEVSALTQAFRETSERNGFCGIGSVKTNIGHLDTAAGIASLIKATLAVKHGNIPPSLNYEAPNPTIDFTTSPFYVNDVLREWKTANGPRRAGVNSLGVGGTNAFAIVEEPYVHPASESVERVQSLLVLSARNRKALDAQCKKLAEHLEAHKDQALADIAYTLLVGRRRFEHRRVLACADHDEAIELLEKNDVQRVATYATDSEGASIVFMFPGGGAQYLGMAWDLYDKELVFKKYVDQGIELLKSTANIDLKALLFGEKGDKDSLREKLEVPSIQLPAIFIIEYALVQLWRSLGVEPRALIGHSMGENTAACVAEVISYEDALGLVRLRGKLMDDVPEGGMLSVELPAEELEKHLGNNLDLASVNSPNLSVASGATEALDKLVTKLDELNVNHQRVRINIAAHSRMLEDILTPFKEYLLGIELNAPKIPFVSNRTGTWITDDQARDPQYWVEHLRNTVNFSDGVNTLLQDGDRVLLEVGPGNTLSSLAKHNPKAIPQRTFASLRHPEEEVRDDAYLMMVLGRLWMCGLSLGTSYLWPDQRRYRVSLPTYAFQHNRYWIEPGKVGPTSIQQYAQLEKIEDFNRWFYEPVWIQQGILAEVNERAETWLIFLDDSGYGDNLKSRLEAKGHDIVTVKEGDAYYQLSDSEYRLSPELGAEGYKALVKDLIASGKAPSRVLHLGLLTEVETFRPGSSFFHRNQEHGFYSLFFLAKSLGEEDAPTEGMHWIVVSNGMQQISGEEVPYPEKATVLGPCRVIPREFPGISCVSVDIALPRSEKTFLKGKTSVSQPHEKLLDMLEVELGVKPENSVVAYRNNVRWEQRFQPITEMDRHKDVNPIRENGVYLITGGLGGIGFTVGKHLASEFSAKLVLINRTPLPERSEWGKWMKKHDSEDPISRCIRKVQELEKIGADLLVFSGDITNVDRMSQILDEVHSSFGAINGVFHAAGVVRDSLIQMKTQSEVEEVFTPKVYGTMVLDELLDKEPLDFLFLYSSTSTVAAPVGQIDYVAANAFLNAYAQNQSTRSDRHTVAVNWGVWNEIGMAAEAANKMGFGSKSDAAVPSQIEAKHSLFERRMTIIEKERRTHLLITHFSPQTHWLLDQHRTSSGQALLPGTAYIELIRAALAEYEEDGPFIIRDLFFLRALFVADKDSKRIRVKLRTSEEGYDVEFQSAYKFEDGSTGWERHAQARILLTRLPRAAELDIDNISSRCGVDCAKPSPVPLRSKQEDHLKFGPRWQVLRQMGYGDNEAFACLSLADEFSDDLDEYHLHPALLDLATGFAMELITGYNDGEKAANLWVPVSYGELRIHHPLEQSIKSWVRGCGENKVSDEFARFDVSITDDTGRVLLEVKELTIKKLENSLDFTEAPYPTSNEVEMDKPKTGTGEVRQLSPAEQAFHHNLTQGILPEEGARAIDYVLGDTSRKQVIVSSLDLNSLIEESDVIAAMQTQSSTSKFSRPELESDFVEARDDVERTLVTIWEELLGVDSIGVKDSFFDLGGHSLVAVRLFAKIKQAFEVDYPISILFEAPTIETCAELIKQEIGEVKAVLSGDDQVSKTRYTHLVPMHPGSGGNMTPFFLVAGMFGNVLNLRHLAHLVGTDRPFYGLQARGLYGDQDPHLTFEEMAEDYIKELRIVQPQGPYFLGGFSGGGITAFEIAKQLRNAGQEIGLLVLLDTPLPQSAPLSSVDRMSIHWQRLRSKGPSYFSEWARNRYQWELQKFQNRFDNDNKNTQPFDFQSELMEIAFRNALDVYSVEYQPFTINLFRPKLDQAYSLGGGRIANSDRKLVFDDNGWTPYVGRLEVTEVPGDHDSMVLEPNVRVLAAKLRDIIEIAESGVRSNASMTA